MPYGWEQSNGVLRLYNLQIHDSGVYICQARNNETRRVFEDKISITITGKCKKNYKRITLKKKIILNAAFSKIKKGYAKEMLAKYGRILETNYKSKNIKII